MSLPNGPISSFPLYSSIKPGFWLAMDDMDRVETVRLDIKELLASPISQNFEWVTDNDPGYAMFEVVTYGGKWWQSQIADNLNIVPGTDSTKWLEVNKSASGFVPWQAGVFPQDLPFVYVNAGDLDNPEIHMYVLASPVRPYVSTDIDAEILAGDWLEVFQGGGADHFVGVFVSLVALQTAFPTAPVGSYAFVDSPGNNAVMYIWDDDDAVWVQSGGTFGDVTGPASAVDQRIAVFDGTTGKLLEDGGQTLNDIQTSIDAGDNFVQAYAELIAALNPKKRAATAATHAALPAFHAVFGSRTQLVGNANGSIGAQDGVAAGGITILLVWKEVGANAKYNGLYTLTDGTVGTPYILTRTLDTQPFGATGAESEFASVDVEQGTLYGGKTFRQETVPLTLDTTAQLWVDRTPVIVGAVPVVATSSEIDTGTDNAKFTSALGLQGSKYLTRNGGKIYSVASGTNTYTGSFTPAFTALVAGVTFRVKFTNANTGASTFNPDGLGAIALKKSVSLDLEPGDILAGAVLELLYDGTNFQIQGVASRRVLTRTSVAVSAGTLTLDLDNKQEKRFECLSAISSAFALAISNATLAEVFTLNLLITGTVAITLPAGFVMQQTDSRFVNATKILTLVGGTAEPFELSFTKATNVTPATIYFTKCTDKYYTV